MEQPKETIAFHKTIGCDYVIIPWYQMEKAEDAIRKADKRRASYYNYYATGSWGDVDNYDMCVDTGVIGVEGAVELMARYVQLHEEKRNG